MSALGSGLHFARQRFVETARRDSGDDTDLASALNALGTTLDRSGAADEALTAYEEALAIYERRLGPDHPSLAQALHNFATSTWSY